MYFGKEVRALLNHIAIQFINSYPFYRPFTFSEFALLMSSTVEVEAGRGCQQPQEAHGWAAMDRSGVLSPFSFSRRANGDKDVTIKILYCGICHTDLHMIKNELGLTKYPLVPGHEIVGEVIKVGTSVSKFKVGDKAGVGAIVGSCRHCHSCAQDLECYCADTIWTFTVGSSPDTPINYGGFSDKIVVDEHFAVLMPEDLPLDGAAPLLCAGITVYSPMMYYGINKPGLHLGVAGLGGLGHMAVKFAKALGLKVSVISTSPSKRKEAVERLGADAFLVSHDDVQMKDAMGTMDAIIDTVSAQHSLPPLLNLLKTNGKLIVLAEQSSFPDLSTTPLLTGRKLIGGSLIGGMKETQEMLDFAAEHHITADIEVVSMEYVNTAMERLAKGDVKYRFVINVGSSFSACQPS
ncbi:hypothetical protein Ancab_003605 [Ancistrocladus abbreviatus]